jgi:hypothetical protein
MNKIYGIYIGMLVLVYLLGLTSAVDLSIGNNQKFITTNTCQKFMYGLGNGFMNTNFDWHSTPNQDKCIRSFESYKQPNKYDGCLIYYTMGRCPIISENGRRYSSP